MADTKRGLTTLQALLADNVVGDISAQDVRDFLVSVYGNWRSKSITVSDTPYAAGNDDRAIMVDASGGAIIVNLPTGSAYDDMILFIEKTDTTINTVTATPTSGDTLDGPGILYSQYDHVLLYKDGTKWHIVAGVGTVSSDTVNNMMYALQPSYNGPINWIGWYIETDTGEALSSAASVTPSVPGYHSHFVINTSSGVGMPFTVRFTGTSVNENTGATTPGDTEDINVTANGYYQTSKSWITAPVISIVEGAKSCTIDIYRTTYWDKGNQNFLLTGCRMEWEPDVSNWDITINIIKVNNDGSKTLIDTQTFQSIDTPPRAADTHPGKYKRGDYSNVISGSMNEGLVVELDTTGVRNVILELKF